MFITLDGVVEAPEKWQTRRLRRRAEQDVMRCWHAAGTTTCTDGAPTNCFRGVFTGRHDSTHAGMMTPHEGIGRLLHTLANPDWGHTA